MEDLNRERIDEMIRLRRTNNKTNSELAKLQALVKKFEESGVSTIHNFDPSEKSSYQEGAFGEDNSPDKDFNSFKGKFQDFIKILIYLS